MEGVIGTLIPFGFFVMVAAIVLVPRYYKSLERQKLQDTLRVAYEKGHEVPPEVIASIVDQGKPPASPARDLRTGIIWLGVAVGLAAFGVAIGYTEPEATYALLGISAFPAFIGLAFVILGMIARGKTTS